MSALVEVKKNGGRNNQHCGAASNLHQYQVRGENLQQHCFLSLGAAAAAAS